MAGQAKSLYEEERDASKWPHHASGTRMGGGAKKDISQRRRPRRRINKPSLLSVNQYYSISLMLTRACGIIYTAREAARETVCLRGS